MGRGGVFEREFTKSLIFRDFDDALKHPLRYVHLFLLHKLLSKKNSENRHRVQSCGATPLPLNEGLALTKCRFKFNHFHSSKTLETWLVSRNR